MNNYPKVVKRQLRGLLEQAYERELSRALEHLAAEIDAWRAGALSAGELAERVHQFDTGIARELFKRYDGSSPAFPVAYAVSGVLSEEDVPDDVWPYLQGPMDFYRTMGHKDL